MLVDRNQVENLLRALNEYKNLSNNGMTNGGVSTDLVDQDEDLAASKNSTSSLRLKKENYSTAYLDNLYVESEIKKKIMFISLNLASDPTVSYFVQKQRREFYEKTKKKVCYISSSSFFLYFVSSIYFIFILWFSWRNWRKKSNLNCCGRMAKTCRCLARTQINLQVKYRTRKIPVWKFHVFFFAKLQIFLLPLIRFK